jgi:hypothetical protein
LLEQGRAYESNETEKVAHNNQSDTKTEIGDSQNGG